MGRVNTPILSIESQKALEEGFKTGKTHAFRARCQLVLLKSENRKSKEVAAILKMCEMSVNNWLVRYANEGIEGLKTKKGRGRKPVINKTTDEVSVLESIKLIDNDYKQPKLNGRAKAVNLLAQTRFGVF
jgi:transposase